MVCVATESMSTPRSPARTPARAPAKSCSYSGSRSCKALQLKPKSRQRRGVRATGALLAHTRRRQPDDPNMTLQARIRRLWSLLLCAANYWSRDNASNTGAALAFYCAFSIAPLLVILLTLAGLFFNEKSVDAQVAAQLAGLFGPAT